MPEPLLVQPTVCCSPEYASVVKETIEYPIRKIGFPCFHSGGIHDRVMETLSEPQTFDPCHLTPNTRTLALATMVGAVIIARTLGESVTLEGLVL